MTTSDNLGRARISQQNKETRSNYNAHIQKIYQNVEPNSLAERIFWGAVEASNYWETFQLNLRAKKLDDYQAKEISKLIKNNLEKIQYLDLGDNYFTTRGLKTFLKYLQKMEIQQIIMDDNNLETNSINYLISIKKYNKSLKRFVYGNMRSVEISKDVLQRLSKLKSKGLAVEFNII